MNSKGTAEWCECSVLPIDGTGTLHSVKQADFYRAQLQTCCGHSYTHMLVKKEISLKQPAAGSTLYMSEHLSFF